MTLFDPGLQPERTELAWRRTALAIGTGSLVAMRLLPVTLGSAWWTLAGASGVAAAALLWVSARRRYGATTKNLRDGHERPLPGGALLAVLSLVVAAGGAAALLVVLAPAH